MIKVLTSFLILVEDTSQNLEVEVTTSHCLPEQFLSLFDESDANNQPMPQICNQKGEVI